MIAPDRPRLLHVVNSLCCGGLESEVVYLVAGLERLGFDQAVCCLNDRGDIAGRLAPSVPVWACAEEVSRAPAFRKLAGHIRSWGPDVIHLRNGGTWADGVLAAMLTGRRGSLVFSIHGWDRIGHMPPRRAIIYRQLARLTPYLASISRETAHQFACETGIPEHRFRILDSGVDVERFRPPDLPRDTGRLVLGCVSRLDPIKAHDVLIEAFARVVAAGHDLELRFFGDGPTRPELERLARERQLGDRVQFLGLAHDIPERLREMDLFVLSSHREGRPVAIMEALASGLPVIATAVGSIPGLVTEGSTGSLVTPGDVAGLAEAIGRLAGAPLQRRQMAAEARRRAVSHLSLDRMVEQYAAFYTEITGGLGPAPILADITAGRAAR